MWSKLVWESKNLYRESIKNAQKRNLFGPFTAPSIANLGQQPLDLRLCLGAYRQQR